MTHQKLTAQPRKRTRNQAGQDIQSDRVTLAAASRNVSRTP